MIHPGALLQNVVKTPAVRKSSMLLRPYPLRYILLHGLYGICLKERKADELIKADCVIRIKPFEIIIFSVANIKQIALLELLSLRLNWKKLSELQPM